MEMEIYILKTIKKIRKETPRRFKELRASCDSLVETLSERLKIDDEKEDEDADKYFDILQAACETKQPKLMDISLEAMKFLIDHAYLRGNKRILVPNPKPTEDGELKSERRILMDLVIETVAKCADEFDDVVHSQVISVFVAAITSSVCQVHEASLILAVGSCINIHLVTRNQPNKNASKAALIQILSVVFFRMETFDARAKMETEAALAALGKSNENDSGPNRLPGPSVPCGEAMYPDVYGHLGYKPSGGTPTPFAGFDSAVATIGHVFPSILHKDAFLIFRALCKLSMKNIQDDGTEPYSLPNKILSLELILHILEHSGPAFKSGDKFILAIRQYLCVSLLDNCTSQNTKVVGLSLQVFVALLNGFKDHLKAELEVFITNILLRLLESENSTFDHKSKVLEVFQTICKDPAALVELFINYDCDLEAIDLFRRIVDAFAKIAKNPMLNYSRNVEFMSRKFSIEESTIRLMGLEGLVVILRSLVTAAGSILISNKQQNGFMDSSKRSSLSINILQNTSTNLQPLNNISIDEVDISLDSNEQNEEESDISSIQSPRNEDGVDESKEGGVGLMRRHDRKQKIQEEIETGILKFNLSPKKGLAYLANLGHIEMTPQGVAKFLRQYSDKLDKTAIGDYLGREREYEDGFCMKVLHEYVDMLNFTNLHFDEAIRLYLSGFRLPGEAQKIDRIMEKFAEKYYLQNKDVFASADMAFILAFSTIMLQTNLHNPAIRDDQRMTKEQFVRQNTGISSDGELPESILLEIYDRIQANPISLNQDLKFKKIKKDDITFSNFIISQKKRRQDAFNDERKEMVQASEAIFKQKRSKNRSVFVRSQGDVAYVRPMFEVAWAPMIGVFSQILEMSDEVETTTLCLEGFQAAIRIACRFDVNTARDTYVNSLAKFTTLESVKEMKPKHLDAIKMLINVALADGDFLFESWGQILRCVSHLSRLQLFGSGLHSDDMFFSESPSNNYLSPPQRGLNRRVSKRILSDSVHHPNGLDPFKLFSTPSRAETSRIIEESNAELVIREIDPALIDRIFSNSHNLSTDSVLHFVTNLCQVSVEEISTTSYVLGNLKGKDLGGDVSSTPRVFSLQKLVEVADLNMHSRPRIAWAKLWSVLANHFTTVGVHDNRALAMYAIDSLKQLSIKFLLKSELSNFNFQRLFLKPFEIIMTQSSTPEIKELILRCLDIMILACANNIRSGWRSIFSVFSTAAGHEKEDIAGIAFEITERLVTQQFDLLIYDFVELMNCLVAFASGPHTQIALSALNHISLCSDNLANGIVQPAINSQHPSSDTLNISWEKYKLKDTYDDSEIFRLWWPLLLGISTRVSDNRYIVRTRALEVLHRILKEYGNLFSSSIWEVIFRGVLFPIMDSAKIDNTNQPQSLWPTHNPPQSKDPASWIGTTSLSVLTVYLSIFNQYYTNNLTSELLPDLLSLIESIIQQDIESLSRIGLIALRDLIISIPVDNETKILTPKVASMLCNQLCTIGIKQLNFNFGTLGYIELDDQVSKLELELLSRNKRQISIHSEVDNKKYTIVKTPYGIGKIKYTETSKEQGEVVKHAVILSWGAMLYTTENYPIISLNDESSEQSISTRLTRDQAWNRFSSLLMSSMVLTLDLVKIIGEAIHYHYKSWSIEQFSDLLTILQCSFDHGRCFNANLQLRSDLKSKGFMRFRDNIQRPPHLIDQVILSCSQILNACFRLFSEEVKNLDYNKSSLVEPIIQRISKDMIELFLAVDDISLGSSDIFIIEEVNAYIIPVTVALRGLLELSAEQFRRYIPWFVPLLSRIVLCQDRSVRALVKMIYERQVNPIMELEALRKWIFYPVIIEYTPDKQGIESDTFYSSSSSSNNNKRNDNQENEKEFNKRILLPSKYDLTLIIPAYNEEERLPIMLDDTIKFLKEWSIVKKITYEIIIVDDGSRDGTVNIVKRYMSSNNEIKLLKLGKNRGKGGAIKRGVRCALGRYILMVDADGATDIRDLDSLWTAISKIQTTSTTSTSSNTFNEDSHGFAIGSRAHLEGKSVATRSLHRTILMYGFHLLVLLLCTRNVKDTQCGFKLFTRATARQLFQDLHLERWSFDIELIYVAESLSIPLVEIAVNWHEVDGSKLIQTKWDIVTTSLTMARDMLCVRLSYLLGIWKVKAVSSSILSSSSSSPSSKQIEEKKIK